jgi:hypothetical protein
MAEEVEGEEMPLALSVQSALGNDRLKPYVPIWTGIHVLAIAALALRLAVAWWSERIHHPDELFQYLEQAHRLVYGYGFIPWEYRFGARNWLLPGALAGLLEVLRLLGLDQPTVYVPLIKSTFALLSVSLVYACYAIGRNLFQEQTGRLAAAFAALWYELLYASSIATPEVLGTYATVGGLALLAGEPSQRKTILAGLLLGTSVALRVQYAVPAGALWVLVWVVGGWRPALLLALSGAAVPIVAGALDAWTWGIPFMSYYNNVVLNLSGVAQIFGQKPLLWYLYALSVASAGLYAAAIVHGALTWRKCWPILLLVACVVVPHSLVAHKEYRFMILVAPLLLPLLADAIVSGLPRLGGPFASRPAWSMAVIAVLAVSVLGSVTRDVFRRDDQLLAMLELSRRNDVSAVLDLAGDWTASGGFYYLHRNVPYYLREQIEGLPGADIRMLVSHVVAPAGQQDMPGFRLAASFRTVAILEQTSPPAAYRRLPRDGREPRLPPVDDRLTPMVRPRF